MHLECMPSVSIQILAKRNTRPKGALYQLVSLEYVSILRIHVLIEIPVSMPPESMIIKMLFNVATPHSSHALQILMLHFNLRVNKCGYLTLCPKIKNR